MRVGGLFSGNRGFERAFSSLGYVTEYLCEIDEVCQAVLEDKFPGSSHDCYPTGALEMTAMMGYFFDRRANSSGVKSSRELCG